MENVPDWEFIEHIRSVYSDFLSFCNDRIKSYIKLLPLKSFNGLVASVSLLLTFLLALTWGFAFMFPIPEPVTSPQPVSEVRSTSSHHDVLDSAGECNVFEGKWIRDESYPLYNASLCPFAEVGFNCLANGRKDGGYMKWKWKPKGCDIPRFNARDILEKLRGKRVVFVGDSLSRTQWESMICMLMTGVDDKRSVYEVNGNKITKQIRFLGVRFSSFNLQIDFYRSVYLVQSGPAPRRSPKRVKSTLRLDKMDDISKEWIDSDVLIFNSGHWWTRSKLFEM